MGFSKMVDMRRSTEEKTEVAEAVCMPGDMADYPYGLCLSLTNEELEKLDLDGDCAAGDTIDLRAFAKVTSVSVYDRGGKPDRRIELQIVQLAVENEDTEMADDEASEQRGRYK